MSWKWALWAAAVPTGAVIAAAAVGAFLPRDHVSSAQAFIQAPPDRVAELVRDVPSQPQWRKGVRWIEVLQRDERRVRYIERSGDGAISFDFLEERPGRLFRSTIVDPTLPFGGDWTIAITQEAGGSTVRIEEHGFVTNVFFRFFAALIFGYDRTIKAYLADLNRAVSASPS